MKAPSNVYESLRAGMEYKLALQAIRKVVKSSQGSDYDQIKEISAIIHSMEEDVERRMGSDNGGENRVAAGSEG